MKANRFFIKGLFLYFKGLFAKKTSKIIAEDKTKLSESVIKFTSAGERYAIPSVNYCPAYIPKKTKFKGYMRDSNWKSKHK